MGKGEERRSCNWKRCVKGDAQPSKESVLCITDEKSLAGHPQSLEIILEAISKDKNNASGKTQWFVGGQSVLHQLGTPCGGRSGSMAVPHQGLDRCFDPQTTGTWLASKQRGAAGELPRWSYTTYAEGVVGLGFLEAVTVTLT